MSSREKARSEQVLPANAAAFGGDLALQMASPLATAGTTCQNCSRTWGDGRTCRFCGQVEGMPIGIRLSSPGRRLGAFILEGILAVLTLGIGYLIWMLIVFGRGQTPGKQVLGMRCARIGPGDCAGWWRLAAREFIAKPVVGLLSSALFFVPYFWLLWDKDNQQLWDKIVGTVVVNDPDKLLLERYTP